MTGSALVRRANRRQLRSRVKVECGQVPPNGELTVTGPRRLFYQVYLAFLLGLNGVVFLPNDGVTDGPGSSAFSASWALAHVASIGVLLTVKRRNKKGLLFAVLFGVYAAATALWSAAPSDSLLYGGMLTGNILVAHALSQEACAKEILRLIGGAIVLLSLAGIVAYYAGYGQVIWLDTRGRPNIFGGPLLRGFFPHKIDGALYATIGGFAIYGTTTGVRRVLSIVVLVWFILLAGSSTGYVLLVVATGVYALTSAAVRARTSVGGFILSKGAMVVLLAPAIWITWAQLLGALGRDSTLTGRTLLWSWGLDAWADKPVFGWGYNAYFQSDSAQRTHASIPELRYYDVPHFHEAYIQTAVDLGAVGLAALLGIIVVTLIRSYRYGIGSDHRDGQVIFTILVVLMVAGLGVYVFPQYNQFSTFLLFVLYFAMRGAIEVLPSGKSQVAVRECIPSTKRSLF